MINLRQFEAECRRDIPLLDAMQLSFIDYGNLSLTMQAPLAPNINNKGTAFGGSIASICLFGGWAVSTLAFIDHDVHNTEIVVYRNEMTSSGRRVVCCASMRISKTTNSTPVSAS